MRAIRIASLVLLGTSVISPGGAVTRQMFVTSVTGAGNLSAWADAGGQTGVAAADAICQARAAAASLPNPPTYRAWISDDLDDAYCRLHGLTGTISSNCGQPSLPATAGPWWRTDGEPFGDALPALGPPLDRVLNPPQFDEFGTAIGSGTVWTGTSGDGSAGSRTCLNWSSASGAEEGQDGSTLATTELWTNSGAGFCSGGNHRVYCFETGQGDPLPIFPAWGRLAFLTSVHGTGDLGSWPQAGGASGIAAGDAICQSLAVTAGIRQPTSFKAWLSDAAVDAVDRFQHDGPWLRLDGIRVATGKADLTDQQLRSSIHRTETGVYLGNWAVWTGTTGAGTAGASHCANWTSGVTGTGLAGSAAAADAAWTESSEPGCDFVWGYLYCLQDLPLVFLDGFESGGTAAWTAAVP